MEAAAAEPVVLEDSVPTDLTVSLSAPTQTDNSHSSQNDSLHVKRLQSELHFHKLALAQKNAAIEKLEAEKRSEIELLKDHIHLAGKENAGLTCETQQLKQKYQELEGHHLRLQSERTALEEDLARSRASAEEWQGRWTALNDQHTAVVAQVNCNEFTVEHFERLRRHESMLRQQLDTFQERHRALERDNRCLRKSADKWRAKFQNQKEEYEKRLNAEIGDVRRSVQDQLAMARASGDEALENRLAETETARSRAVKQVHQLLAQMDELKDRLRDDELRREKMRLEKDQSETTCVELKRRMAALNAAHRRLERRSAEAEEGARQAADDLRLQLVSHQRIGHQLQLKLDHQAEHVKELEQALLGLGEDDEENAWSRWPVLRRLQAQHGQRLNRRVAQLEGEIQVLQDQSRQLADAASQWQAEAKWRDELVARLSDRSPQTVTLFRQMETQVRELRSQLHLRDVQLADGQRRVEKLKRIRHQLTADLETMLRDRTELEAVRRILDRSQ